MKFRIRVVAYFFLASCMFSLNLEAMGPGEPEPGVQQLPPAPPGPYQLDRLPMSTDIQNQSKKQAPPYTQYTEEIGGYNGSGYYGGTYPSAYPQTNVVPDAYYPPQGGYYGYGPQPGYQNYQQGYQPGYYPNQGNLGYPYR